MASAALTELEQRAREHGIDLIGLVDVRRFDRSQPSEGRCARLFANSDTVIVCASSRPGAGAAHSVAELAGGLRRIGFVTKTVSPRQCEVSFARLAEAAGIGVVSPVIHRLLHPRFGPWVTVHGAILVAGHPFGAVDDASIAASFRPCCACPRPCVAACPAHVHDGKGGSDEGACHRHRHAGGCADACAVVRSCPIGAAQVVEPARELDRHRAEAQRLALRHGAGMVMRLRRWLGR